MIGEYELTKSGLSIALANLFNWLLVVRYVIVIGEVGPMHNSYCFQYYIDCFETLILHYNLQIIML